VVFFFFKQKMAYEIFTRLEFRRVLFRSTLERLNRILKRAEKTRAVLLRKGWPAALGRACFPQIAHQFAHGERHADTVLREGPTKIGRASCRERVWISVVT